MSFHAAGDSCTPTSGPAAGRAGDLDGAAAGEVTIVVPTYNGRALLEVLLPSVARQTRPPRATVVVDDCSTDDSLSWLREQWPEIGVVALTPNRGVTAALNECLRAGSTEMILLLNNDVELHENCLAELLDALERQPGAVAAVAKLVDFHDRRLLDGAGDVFYWRGAARRRGQGEPDDGRYDDPQPIFAACGAVVLMRRSAVEEVGEFDERYVAGLEDVDWSFRAQLLGHDILYVPGAVAYHMGSATIGRTLTRSMAYLNWRNWLWLIAKDYPASAFLRHGPELIVQQIRTLGVALYHGWPDVWLRAWRDAIRGLPAVLDQRRAVQRTRCRSVRELESIARRR